jgi:hypothetical protein
MSHLRRVNASNVDLNRNFLAGEPYSGAPETYEELNDFLNPSNPPSKDLYLLKAAWLVLRRGMPALKQAVVGGQYEYSKGLFFGGKTLQEELQKYSDFLRGCLGSAEQVLAVDVHTGLGPYGNQTLLVEARDSGALRQLLGVPVTLLDAEAGPAYRVRGGLQDLVVASAPGARVQFVGQEFGTYAPARVLHALREENRLHHFGNPVLDHPVKARLKETFSPSDETWRRSVLKQGAELMRAAVRSF